MTNTLRLLTLSDEVIELVEKGQLSAGHARALIAIEDKWTQIRLARKAVAEGLSVRAVEKLVRKATEPEPETKEKPPEKRKTGEKMKKRMSHGLCLLLMKIKRKMLKI